MAVTVEGRFSFGDEPHNTGLTDRPGCLRTETIKMESQRHRSLRDSFPRSRSVPAVSATTIVGLDVLAIRSYVVRNLGRTTSSSCVDPP
jgi:hypothetical protein